MKQTAAFLTVMLLSITALFTLQSCKDSENGYNEFADWQTRNEVYFGQVYGQAYDSIQKAQADYGTDWQAHTSWRIYSATTIGDDVSPSVTDNVVVRILEKGQTSGSSPLASDSVKVHYRGMLIPTVTVYGLDRQLVFDESYHGQLNTDTDVPAAFPITNLIDGWAAALQRMHIDDRWVIYIPHHLAYQGNTIAGNYVSIPAYSTLIFDVKLSYFRQR